jgi:hypothetical protein
MREHELLRRLRRIVTCDLHQFPLNVVWPKVAAACGPMARVFTISAPRRKPLYTSTGIRAPTISIISGSASIVARPLSSTRPP